GLAPRAEHHRAEAQRADVDARAGEPAQLHAQHPTRAGVTPTPAAVTPRERTQRLASPVIASARAHPRSRTGGAMSGTVVRARGAGDAVWMLGGRYEVKVSSEETAGAMTGADMSLPAG